MIALQYGSSIVLGVEGALCLLLVFGTGVMTAPQDGHAPGLLPSLAVAVIGGLLLAMAWAVWP